jgi:hypothetical protein
VSVAPLTGIGSPWSVSARSLARRPTPRSSSTSSPEQRRPIAGAWHPRVCRSPRPQPLRQVGCGSGGPPPPCCPAGRWTLRSCRPWPRWLTGWPGSGTTSSTSRRDGRRRPPRSSRSSMPGCGWRQVRLNTRNCLSRGPKPPCACRAGPPTASWRALSGRGSE